jgi:hypothetical protein
LTIAVSILLGNAADLLQNHRPDLMMNGIAEVVVAVALLIWAALPKSFNHRGTEITELNPSL